MTNETNCTHWPEQHTQGCPETEGDRPFGQWASVWLDPSSSGGDIDEPSAA